jgi:hypothetical protein
LSPDLVLPGPVPAFRVTQEGETLVLSWNFPKKNVMLQPLTQLEGFRLERCAGPGANPAPGCLPDFVQVADINLSYPQVGEVRGEAVVYRDRNLSPGKCYSYRAAAYAQGGHPGTWSQIVSHAWGVLPRAPGLLHAEAGDREVQLSWPAALVLQDGKPLIDLAGYMAYRRVPGGDWQRLTPEPLTATGFQDVAVQNEVEYTYMIRSVRRLGRYTLASLDSPTKTVVPQDLTPPPPLLNLVAAITPKGVELRWEPSPATDLAGYRVYRRRGGEAKPTRLTPELVHKPYFVDAQAAKGQTYYYTVTAVDSSKRANESLPSEEAAVIL